MRRRPERLFAFRLASQLGCTVRELLARMSSREFAEWIAYYSIEPHGEQRADWRAAQVTQAVYRCMGGVRAPMDAYVLRFGLPQARDWREIRAGLIGWVSRHNRQAQNRTER